MVGADLPLTVERHIVATFAWGGDDRTTRPRRPPERLLLPPRGRRAVPRRPAPSRTDRRAGRVRRARRGRRSDRRLGSSVVRRAPALQHATARGGWASLYDVSPDWQPVIGEIAPGVYRRRGDERPRLQARAGARQAPRGSGDRCGGRPRPRAVPPSAVRAGGVARRRVRRRADPRLIPSQPRATRFRSASRVFSTGFSAILRMNHGYQWVPNEISERARWPSAARRSRSACRIP